MPDAVDVPGDHVPAQAIAEAQRALEVHRARRRERAERGARHRLRPDLELDLALRGRADRQAHAVDGERGAELHRRHQHARADGDAQALPDGSLPTETTRPTSSMMPVNIEDAYIIGGGQAPYYVGASLLVALSRSTP